MYAKTVYYTVAGAGYQLFNNTYSTKSLDKEYHDFLNYNALRLPRYECYLRSCRTFIFYYYICKIFLFIIEYKFFIHHFTDDDEEEVDNNFMIMMMVVDNHNVSFIMSFLNGSN